MIGTIRQVDELGRVVIPKGIRQHLGILPNSQLEFVVKGDTICIRQYSRLSRSQAKITRLLNTIYHTQNVPCAMITDEGVYCESDNCPNVLRSKLSQLFELPTCTTQLDSYTVSAHPITIKDVRVASIIAFNPTQSSNEVLKFCYQYIADMLTVNL
ncbi:MAG: AbrB/MazE/SpoVT family DNA-binding domain-containing protein [Clostridia bacterium]|nr:AbrB/MazE/SpoVT family DNA-binding domain-containing protein [Clostridia bacterium]